MGITSGIVLFAVIWFMVLFVVLPLNLQTQGDVGQVVPGTMKSSPNELNLKRKLWIVTGVSVVLWAVIATIILMEWIAVADFDLFTRFGPGNSPVFPEN